MSKESEPAFVPLTPEELKDIRKSVEVLAASTGERDVAIATIERNLLDSLEYHQSRADAMRKVIAEISEAVDEQESDDSTLSAVKRVVAERKQWQEENRVLDRLLLRLEAGLDRKIGEAREAQRALTEAKSQLSLAKAWGAEMVSTVQRQQNAVRLVMQRSVVRKKLTIEGVKLAATLLSDHDAPFFPDRTDVADEAVDWLLKRAAEMAGEKAPPVNAKELALSYVASMEEFLADIRGKSLSRRDAHELLNVVYQRVSDVAQTILEASSYQRPKLVWVGEKCGIISPYDPSENDGAYSVGDRDDCVLCDNENCMAVVQVME